MHILLINSNPVVSKLFKCVIEDEHMELLEVSVVNKIKNKDYEIIFIDESLCKKNLNEILKRFPRSKKVCISYDLTEIKEFDATLQKPFLPSQIMDIVEDFNFLEIEPRSILDTQEIETIKSLLNMEDIVTEELAVKKKLKKPKKQNKKTKELLLKVKKLDKKAIKRFLKGKEIKIRIQLDEEF
jgi:hypothetical protein